MGKKFNSVTASIGAENTFSGAITLQAGQFELALSGTWSATVVVQKKYRDANTWYQYGDTFSVNGVWIGENGIDDCEVRFGIPSGEYGSGTVVGRISQSV